MDCSRLQQTGRVMEVSAGQADIAFDTPAGCAGCNGRCGIALVVGLLGGERGNRMQMAVEPGIAAGDRVRVTIEAGRLLLLVALTYTLPIAGLVLGALAVSAWWPAGGDPAALAGAAFGAGIAVLPALILRRQRPGPVWLGARVLRDI